MKEIALVLLTIIIAPIIGGILTGIDRKITARMQNRFGPPILQPFYDLFKLFSKETIVVSSTQILYAFLFLVFNMVALVMFVLKMDLLLILFVLAFAVTALILGAMSTNSPYSRIGAHRELISVLAYEPVLIAMIIGIYFVTGSFKIDDVIKHNNFLIFELPFIFIAFTYVLTIKLRKSPFDLSTSHHAHQEIVKGITTEFAGPILGLIELGHWYELVLLFLFIGLFFAKNIVVAIIAMLLGYFLEILIDNISARLTWKIMLRLTWSMALGLALVNLIWVYIKYRVL
ncbi:respiratory-chain NADH dehydrogenase, subunit 1 [Caldicellulosiruptor saccharolyticus DSM 8903]|uniref:Respiratory-chain NADH dehydrogenase, subunit 1 n=1 Tax=Caldicellulosiruptor saccharolyticus (strain ATCC 43494 / DSM 8903 / Tp8T 6331) TaxID=351627 RepID=A4XJP3_CALS8|nr:complex I subunit 1 family protein [Caldicellulosiruptor saccharolyticus]ABP67128.1 respiratory-chain NADH dehydrogenase, subunit 1 [Caldicellulosiruptor saccharolyticus DSM 8903]